ncbi:hypothetical protein ABZ891_16265 [Streptomyces sp. NPDC047023]|uniref:hypothetical protein n=1 Tax=Streptomyces sp. NPDC047023 TaxID=3155139 RepID=UPI0033E1A7A4
MKIKHIAIAAAAAVVGPTVLMATPALADEVRNPALTTPDTAPKDDTAPAAGSGTEAGTGSGSGSGSGEQANPAAPASGGAGKTAEKQAAAGPKLTLDGLPEKFRAGGDWREFSMHVDNAGRDAVDDHSLELVLWTLDTFRWEADDIRAEIYAPDSQGVWGWHAVEADGSEEVYSFSLADVDIEKNEVFDLRLRMKFGKDTPASRFSLSTTAEGGTADRVRYVSEVTAAGEQERNQGPKITVNGLPAGGFTAGGAWQEFSIGVDNTGKKKIDTYGFTVFFDNSIGTIRSEHLSLEVWDGTRWIPEKDAQGAYLKRAVAEDSVSEIRLRARFHANAPVGNISITVVGDEPGPDGVTSDVAFGRTSVNAPATGDGGTGGLPDTDGGTGDTGDTGGNRPEPDGGTTTPVKDTTPGTTAGKLAETGSDAATSWAVGGAGLALSMGAALVAGTGRRRRPTA